jgi:methyl-accepting chemotaxis protein
MKVFDMTLSALKDSGRVPVSLEPDNGEYREVPKAKEPVYGKLEAVSKIWKEFSVRIEAVLKDGNRAEENLPWIVKSNIFLLKEMDAVVDMMQMQSEKRVGKLLVIGFIGVLLGVCATVFAIMMIQSVIKRLHAIQDFSKQLGTGDLTATSDLGGKDELGMIGNTLDEMVGNLRVMFLSMNDDADNLNDSSSKLANIAREMSSGVENVSGRSNTVATAAEEMSSNMDSVAAATEEASTNVTIVATSAEEMTATINEIAQNSEKARTGDRPGYGDHHRNI